MNTMNLTLSLIVLLLCSVVSSCLAADHNVDWGFGIDYTNWANGKNVKVGDNLVFSYAPQGHTVTEVGENDYQSCTATNVFSTDQSGNTVVPLKTAGTHYFICNVPGHCQSGMKVSVTVVAAGYQSGIPSPPAMGTPSLPSPTTTNCRGPPPPGIPGYGGYGYSSSATTVPLGALCMTYLVAAVFVSLL